MNTKVRRHLIELARQRLNQSISYQKLADECKLGLDMKYNPDDRKVLGNILSEISLFEHANGRPLLSSLVLRSGDKTEGDGFYKLAEQLGHGKWQSLKSEGVYEVSQMTACIEFWQDEKNYLKFR